MTREEITIMRFKVLRLAKMTDDPEIEKECEEIDRMLERIDTRILRDECDLMVFRAEQKPDVNATLATLDLLSAYPYESDGEP
jgi:hypothetical protein